MKWRNRKVLRDIEVNEFDLTSGGSSGARGGGAGAVTLQLFRILHLDPFGASKQSTASNVP